jgi:hypothetical protein
VRETTSPVRAFIKAGCQEKQLAVNSTALDHKAAKIHGSSPHT